MLVNSRENSTDLYQTFFNCFKVLLDICANGKILENAFILKELKVFICNNTMNFSYYFF